MYKDAVSILQNTSMSNDKWKAAIEKANSYMNIAKDKKSNEWFALINEYYMTKLDKRIKQTTIETTQLINRVANNLFERGALQRSSWN